MDFSRRAARFAAIASVILLAGCASLNRADVQSTRFAEPQTAYQVTGRLSARHETDAFTATFHWIHNGDRDELDLASPLGQTVARLSGDGHRVELRTADGRIESASDWTSLTSRGLGWALPVQGLGVWIQGAPRKDTPFTVEAGDDASPHLLRQDGWTIVYEAFAKDAAGVSRPARMTLQYPGIELKIVIDGWQ